MKTKNTSLLLATFLVLVASPALAQQLNSLQQYLYTESGGYVVAPQPAPIPQPVQPYVTAQVQQEYIYEEEYEETSDSGEALRGLLTSSGN